MKTRRSSFPTPRVSGGVRWLLAVLVPVVLAACGARVWPGASGPADAEENLRRAAEALQDEDFHEAAETLRALAGECEAGEAGREAVLLLAVLEVDPRNPAGSPDAAAQLAARYLQLPSASPSSRAVAGSLYLVALDHGAAPVHDVLASVPPGSPLRRFHRVTSTADRAPWRVADRFEDCETGGGAIPLRRPPELSGTPQRKLLEAARAELKQLDSLRTERDFLLERVHELAREAERVPVLRARIDSLEQELDRIRELLPNGSGSPPRLNR